MKKSARMLAAAMAAVMMLTACGSGSAGSTTAAPAGDSKAAETQAEAGTEAKESGAAEGEKAGADGVLKVALILPGKKDDVSFNQAMFQGMQKYVDAHANEIDLKVVENVYEVADIEPALMDFADQGYDEMCIRDRYCKETVYMDLTEVRAVAADSRLAAVFNTAEGTPLLHMDEVGYNFWGEPILMSKEYYMDGILKHTVMRKKI